MTSADAPVIVGNEPGSFARSVLAERHPTLIERVRGAFPWPLDRQRALDALLGEITDGVISPLGREAHDGAEWRAWGAAHFGRSWFDVPFLWAESYFYRRLLAATGYFDAGPWQGVDPFAPFKRAELRGATVDEELAALDGLVERPADDARADALLQAALWGNRADLGFRMSATGADSADSHLVADDSARLWSLLPPDGAAEVHLIADNAGRELIPDLVLLDHLLHTRRAAKVVLHLKPYPYFVSDATMQDALAALHRLRDAPGHAAGIGTRVWSALTTDRLAIRAHAFHCAPLPYSAMPADLRRDLSKATVTIFKGDLNYRRLVGDQLWPPTTPFATRVAHFPGPAAALRTLKSDVIVGLTAPTVTALEAATKPWRTTGTHALIQVNP
ncbi:damage-control phosphatase ARMT1 family protein [Embleya sp. NBC_00896]|uniref:damage-control phosphatase ARMT1 family protein n=1 Tax=Embleya sp. NBC_00896 TaxID=2975961 RepID=UPI00386A585F|nr:damage-control phosphatase ARMT1 family protein [Embleya sp. NBC_00896]